VALLGFAALLLVLIELALRGFGYGPELGLVVTRGRMDDIGIMGLNPLAWERFTLRPIERRPGEGTLKSFDFLDPKPPGVFRIFFIGGSSVQGVPYGRNATMCAFLETLLQAAWPDVRVEVINCGVSAVNSYSLRAWTPELMQYQPDLLIVYAGHNEFYGFYGPGSLHGVGTSRRAVLAHMWFRELRLGQVVRDAVNAVRSSPPPETAATLMELMARNRLIRLDSPTYTACRENFRANLDDIVHAAQAEGVPVVLCGLVSNERDLVPMVSANREGLGNDRLARWREPFQQASAMIAASRWDEALTALTAAAQIDDTHAELVYRMAQCHEKSGRFDEARKLYRRARDLDALRFRATTEFNEVIRGAAASRAAYVDTVAAFEAACPNGLIGWNLVTDHLHPTARGHYLIARAICESLAANREKLALRPMPPGALVSSEDAAERQGCDELTELVASLQILKLMAAYPFAGSPNAGHAKELLSDTARRMEAMPPEVVRAMDRWVQSGTTRSFHFDVAREYLSAGNRTEALAFLRRADRAAEPHSAEAVEIKLAIARCAVADNGGTVPREARDKIESYLRHTRETAAIHPDQRGRLQEAISEFEQMLRQ